MEIGIVSVLSMLEKDILYRFDRSVKNFSAKRCQRFMSLTQSKESMINSNIYRQVMLSTVTNQMYQNQSYWLLTDKENDTLLSLFTENNKFQDLGQYSYNLIYKRSTDGWEENKFKGKCHDRENLLCIILDTDDNVFGGYTSIGWKGNSSYREDPDDKAFTFTRNI